MNKKSIKKLLSYASEELPLATLGVIQGMLEEHTDGRYVEAYDCIEELKLVIEAFEELQEIQEQECADRTREAFEVFDRLLLRREPQLSDE